MRDEHDGVAAFAGAPDLGNPFTHPAVEFEGRLTGDVPGLADLERTEESRSGKPAFRVLPVDHEPRRLRNAITLFEGFVVTGANLVGQLDSLRSHFVGLGYQHRRPPRNRQVVEDRRASIALPRSWNQYLPSNDGSLIESAG